MKPTLFNTWKRRTNQLKAEAYVVYLACRDPRVPWYAKILIVCAIGYAFSPIDRLLNSVPIIGYLDHLILVPLGVVLAFKKLIPSPVLADCRKQAMNRKKPANRFDASITMGIWFLFVSLVILSATWAMKDWNLVLGQWLRWFTKMAFIPQASAR
jgi:uncharacterized membrane protein YkvA (DUF1232 family)